MTAIKRLPYFHPSVGVFFVQKTVPTNDVTKNDLTYKRLRSRVVFLWNKFNVLADALGKYNMLYVLRNIFISLVFSIIFLTMTWTPEINFLISSIKLVISLVSSSRYFVVPSTGYCYRSNPSAKITDFI